MTPIEWFGAILFFVVASGSLWLWGWMQMMRGR